MEVAKRLNVLTQLYEGCDGCAQGVQSLSRPAPTTTGEAWRALSGELSLSCTCKTLKRQLGFPAYCVLAI